MNCESCPLRAQCTKPCDAVEKLLPQEHTARLGRAYAPGGVDFLRDLERRRREVRIMLDYREQLRGRMRQAFDLKFIEGLTQAEIARRLRIARRVVGIYLQRAYARIAKLMVSAKRHAR